MVKHLCNNNIFDGQPTFSFLYHFLNNLSEIYFHIRHFRFQKKNKKWYLVDFQALLIALLQIFSPPLKISKTLNLPIADLLSLSYIGQIFVGRIRMLLHTGLRCLVGSHLFEGPRGGS